MREVAAECPHHVSERLSVRVAGPFRRIRGAQRRQRRRRSDAGRWEVEIVDGRRVGDHQVVEVEHRGERLGHLLLLIGARPFALVSPAPELPPPPHGGRVDPLTDSEACSILRRMSAIPTRDRRAERREATRAEILEAAWELMHEHGVAGLSLRDLGEKVGMRAQSLYSYFDSKEAIYDALFEEGFRECFEQLRRAAPAGDARADFRARCRTYVDFCLGTRRDTSCCSSARSRGSSRHPRRTRRRSRPWS